MFSGAGLEREGADLCADNCAAVLLSQSRKTLALRGGHCLPDAKGIQRHLFVCIVAELPRMEMGEEHWLGQSLCAAQEH